jgi:hypothetical protein
MTCPKNPFPAEDRPVKRYDHHITLSAITLALGAPLSHTCRHIE